MSYVGSFQMWLGVAILIGLLFILVVSLKNSAAKVDAGRTDLERWHGSVTGWFLALVALIVFMAFQNLVLLIVLLSSLGRRLAMDSTSGMLAVRYILPAFLSFLFYALSIYFIVWVRKPWVPKMASALLWLAGPVVSIPAYALFGMQPGPADFAIPSGVAVIGTVYLLFSKRSRAVYRVPAGKI